MNVIKNMEIVETFTIKLIKFCYRSLLSIEHSRHVVFLSYDEPLDLCVPDDIDFFVLY